MAKFTRNDGRSPGELRPVRITPDFVRTAGGSCLLEMGGTRLICTASIVPGVPPWREASGQGWMTAEYGMLPASTTQRKSRPIGKADGRSVEIQRIIGRVLRNAIRFDKIGLNTIYLDCDVLEADGGTRTAAINGAYVALARAVARASAQGLVDAKALGGAVSAVSVGVVEGRALLDLNYKEDSAADVDMNIAMLNARTFVELQGSSERRPFDQAELGRMLRLARQGIRQILDHQRRAIARR